MTSQSTSSGTIPVTVAYGDGIGPEIMESVIRILQAAGAPLDYQVVEIGEKAYLSGHTSGIPTEAWDTIRRNKAFLKAPITTPQGGGYKSLNVTIRKSLGLYANVRPTKSYAPYVASPHSGMDLVIVRENEEDLYAGIEHQQTAEVTQVLKLITRPGSERIIRYAFEYATAHGRRKVTCMSKDNIMKHTDGLFHKVFDEVAKEYPDIQSEHHIIDIGAARVAAMPETFDVIVTLNLYGDIISDIAAQVAGSVGLAGSANIGTTVSMFEAVHGSAPDIAGKDVANPSGLLMGAVQMLVHLGKADIAEKITNAWLCTLESGIHTADVFRSGLSEREVGTKLFTDAIIERLGQRPTSLKPVSYGNAEIHVPPVRNRSPRKELQGVDVFLDWADGDRNPDRLGTALEAATPDGWELKMITNRGVKVYPDGLPETFWTDHWRCRFLPASGRDIVFADILQLLSAMEQGGFDVIKTEHLYTFDGERGYSLGQGE
ncbi:MAG: NADP-dependent isocitrate dehydrogenase [Bacteroidetes bacterium]|nr:NADP-dependent isocitrate dehydrogenase [Bacteroidota bacterium]